MKDLSESPFLYYLFLHSHQKEKKIHEHSKVIWKKEIMVTEEEEELEVEAELVVVVIGVVDHLHLALRVIKRDLVDEVTTENHLLLQITKKERIVIQVVRVQNPLLLVTMQKDLPAKSEVNQHHIQKTEDLQLVGDRVVLETNAKAL